MKSNRPDRGQDPDDPFVETWKAISIHIGRSDRCARYLARTPNNPLPVIKIGGMARMYIRDYQNWLNNKRLENNPNHQLDNMFIIATNDRIPANTPTIIHSVNTLPAEFQPRKLVLQSHLVTSAPDYFGLTTIFMRAEDWIINDIHMGEQSQLVNSGGVIPGFCFAPTAVDTDVSFDNLPPGVKPSITATYVGTSPEACGFCCYLYGKVSNQLQK